jgi:hypothetical protein
VQTLGHAAEPDTARRQLVDYGENVLGTASHAVKLPDREDVASAKVIEAGVKFGSRGRRTTHPVVDEGAGGTGLAKGVELKLWALVGGRHPGVPDDCDNRPCLIIPSTPRF